jgi:hypothetical protein
LCHASQCLQLVRALDETSAPRKLVESLALAQVAIARTVVVFVLCVRTLSACCTCREFEAVVKDGIGLNAPLNESNTNDAGIRLGPVSRSMLEWHFSFMGPPGTDYEGGVYHGRVLLHNDYPLRAPRVQMLTPSGRFAVGKDLCLSATVTIADIVALTSLLCLRVRTDVSSRKLGPD